MNKLVVLKKDDVFTTSEVIANGCDVKHDTVQRLIRKYQNDLSEFGQVGFEIRAVKYKRGSNDKKIYLLNEPQTTLLMTYMKNTPVVREFKKALVKEFFEMRKFIMERHTDEWVESRKQSKLNRKVQTDVIKELVEYAQANGSKNANRYYSIYSKLADKIVGIKNRDEAHVSQLNALNVVENVMSGIIKDCIAQGVEYHEIYKVCQKKLEVFSALRR